MGREHDDADHVTVLRQSRITLCTMGPDLRYTWIQNPPAAIARSWVVGARDDEIFSDEEAAALMALERRVLATGVGESREFALKIRGRDRVHAVIAEPLQDPRGNVVGLTVAVIDVTTRHEVERCAACEGADVLASERAAKCKAERAVQLKDTFLATLSHELRTPLNAILGWAQVLRKSLSTPPPDMVATGMVATGMLATGMVAKALDVVERNAHAQARLIEELLNVTRIDSGKLRLAVEQVALDGIVQDVIESMRLEAEAKGITFYSAFGLDECVVSGDPGRLRQVVSNLVANAIKFTPPTGWIRVDLRPVGGLAQLRVSDSGRGISQEFLPFVFGRYRQAPDLAAQRSGGLGLGLAIVQNLVQLHGGSARAESEGEGKGATFTVTIPLASAPCSGMACLTQERVRLDGVRVLVVDDEQDVRDFMEILLEREGATVITAGSVTEALKHVDLGLPDVVVSDIGMSGLDGYDLLRLLRGLPNARGGRIPAIALTAFAGEKDRRRVLAAGYDAHVAKPLDPPRLISTIARLARRRVEERGDSA